MDLRSKLKVAKAVSCLINISVLFILLSFVLVRSGWSQKGGRPLISRPLFTYRAKSKHRIIPGVRFSEKRGRKGGVRLSRNSLLKRHIVGNNGHPGSKKQTTRRN